MHLGAPVRTITQHDDHVTVTTDSVTVDARHVVVTTPPALVLDIAFDPALPEDRATPVFVPGGERIALVRHAQGVSAVHGVCAHQGGPLYEGKVIDGCLTCRACEAVCPADVPYGELIDAARRQLVAGNPQQRGRPAFIAAVLTRPWLRTAVHWLLWLYQRTSFGEPTPEFAHDSHIHDVEVPEWIAWTPLLIAILVFGVYPNLLLKVMSPAVNMALQAYG